jgi:hypothetical protein
MMNFAVPFTAYASVPAQSVELFAGPTAASVLLALAVGVSAALLWLASGLGKSRRKPQVRICRPARPSAGRFAGNAAPRAA